MKEQIEDAIEHLQQLTWSHWSSRVRQPGRTRVTEPASFGPIDYYELVDGEVVRVEWTAMVLGSRDLKRGRRLLNEIVADAPSWSQPITWGDPFHDAHDEDAVILHRWNETDIYLALRHEGDEIPVRLCLVTTLRANT